MAAVEAPLHASDLTEPVNDVKLFNRCTFFDDVQLKIARMAVLRKHASIAMALLLLGVLFIMCNLNLALASSSGGVAGGSFFDSDSSSSSKSFTDDHSERVMAHHHEQHDSPPYRDDTEHASHGGGGPFLLFLIFSFGLLLVGFCKDNSNGNAITVIKIQVATSGGTGSSIQKDLSRIAEAADTSSLEGVSYLLTEVILTLHQNPGYCIAGYSSVDLKRSREDGETCYNQISLEERAKFDEETLVNLNGKEKMRVKKSKEEGQKFEEEKLLNGFGSKYIVITILVAAKGVHKLPSINGAEDLQRALDKLRSLVSRNLLAGEVLWTPQKENDTLSERELLEDYPQLAKAMKSFLVKKQE